MARRKPPEEHTNHEAWAIPYGDLITLLLAFFVVMYAISSVNAGKYRVVSESLASAFRGTPQTADPIALGETLRGPTAEPQAAVSSLPNHLGEPRSVLAAVPVPAETVAAERAAQLGAVAREVEQALAGLVMQDQVVVRNHGDWVEVELRTDMLFGSGSATLAPAAEGVISRLAEVLRAAPNPIRVEGHTDDVPIRSAAFPSNWELSAARSASVVRLLAGGGVDPSRLAVLGLGEFRPAASNATPAGRNANRRVLLIILGSDNAPEGGYAAERGSAGDGNGDSAGAGQSPPGAPPAEAAAAAAQGEAVGLAVPDADPSRPASPLSPPAAPAPALPAIPRIEPVDAAGAAAAPGTAALPRRDRALAARPAGP
jgi:chemotaxis protein MotB